MNKRIIQHEIKLQKSVVFILALIVAGLFANAYGPVPGVKDAMAELFNGSTLYLNIHHQGNISGN